MTISNHSIRLWRQEPASNHSFAYYACRSHSNHFVYVEPFNPFQYPFLYCITKNPELRKSGAGLSVALFRPCVATTQVFFCFCYVLCCFGRSVGWSVDWSVGRPVGRSADRRRVEAADGENERTNERTTTKNGSKCAWQIIFVSTIHFFKCRGFCDRTKNEAR